MVGSIEPFEFRLDRFATFPNGCIHLRPEPDKGFRELTDRLWAAFPECPPYGGEFPDSTPHLTLDLVHAGVTQASTEALLAQHPRSEVHAADCVDLAWYEPGGCGRLAAWPLGQA